MQNPVLFSYVQNLIPDSKFDRVLTNLVHNSNRTIAIQMIIYSKKIKRLNMCFRLILDTSAKYVIKIYRQKTGLL